MSGDDSPSTPSEEPPASRRETEASFTTEPPHRNRARARSTRLAFGALVVVCLIWGYNWVVMKVALNYSQPFTFAPVRAFCGAIYLFILILVMRRPLRPKAFALTALLGLLQTTGFVGLIMWALESGGAGKTSVLVYIMPFWLLLMAWVVLGEKLRGLQWLSVGLALAGLIFILSPWKMQGSLMSTCLAVIAGISWAGSAVVAKVLNKRIESTSSRSLPGRCCWGPSRSW